MKKILLVFAVLISSKFYGIENEKTLFTEKKAANNISTSIRLDSNRVRPRNVLKVNLTPVILGSYSFQYEYGITKKLSLALGFGQLNLSQLAINKVNNQLTPKLPNKDGIQNMAVTGWSITPEIRLYSRKPEENAKPQGNYLALYYRYSSTSLTGEYTFKTPPAQGMTDTISTLTSLDFKHSGYSIGLMFGYQWLIGKHFSIDWWILGGGRGVAKSEFKYNTADMLIADNEQESIQTDLEDIVKEAKLPGLKDGPEITTSPNVVTLKLNKWAMYSIRSMGLCIGFTF